MRERVKERRRRERGSQAVVERCQPSVWSMRSSLEEASQAREGHTHTHTHTYVHTQTYTTIPKGETFIEHKNTLYTHLYDKFKEHTDTEFGLSVLHLSAHI